MAYHNGVAVSLDQIAKREAFKEARVGCKAATLAVHFHACGPPFGIGFEGEGFG